MVALDLLHDVAGARCRGWGRLAVLLLRQDCWDDVLSEGVGHIWITILNGWHRRVVVRLGNVHVVYLFAERHFIDEVVVGHQILAYFLPRYGVKQVKQADVEDKNTNHEAYVVAESTVELGEDFCIFKFEKGDE